MDYGSLTRPSKPGLAAERAQRSLLGLALGFWAIFSLLVWMVQL